MTYVRGVVEIVFARPLTMAEEWARDHRWTDWKGESFGGQGEWDYVWSQSAVEKVLPSGVVFDQGHGGWRLARFRRLYVERVAAAGGGGELVPTLEEVAAARLYTGPAYEKVNGFMRLVGQVKERHWRARLAQLRGFTYSSTVHHLMNAIRKLTQIAALEQQHRQEEAALGGGGGGGCGGGGGGDDTQAAAAASPPRPGTATAAAAPRRRAAAPRCRPHCCSASPTAHCTRPET